MRRRIETTKRLHHLERTATISGSQMANFKSKLVSGLDDSSSPESLGEKSSNVITEEDLDADESNSEDDQEFFKGKESCSSASQAKDDKMDKLSVGGAKKEADA